MPYRTYDQVSHLDTGTQHQLLQHGDAVERVWAAWALGVALGTKSAPDLLISLHESPESGTRRHLLIILAGLGEQHALRIFAQDDPDEYVRATAFQYLIRIGHDTDAALQQFVRERVLHDSSSIVRLAILNEAPLKSPILRFDELTQLIHDPYPEVRRNVIERLIATVALDQLFPGVLEDHMPREDQKDLRQQLLLLCIQAGGAERLPALGSTLAPDRALEILEHLVDAKAQFDWEQLAPLSLFKNPHYDVLLIQLLRPTSIIPATPWLLDGIARAATWPKPQDRPEAARAAAVHTYAWHATQMLIVARAQLSTITPGTLDSDTIRLTTVYLQAEIAELEWELDHDEEEWKAATLYKHDIHKRRELLTILTKMNATD